MNDAWWMMGEVGTDAGSEKDTEDWVGVTKVDLPIATGEFSRRHFIVHGAVVGTGIIGCTRSHGRRASLSSAAAATSIPAATSTWSSAPTTFKSPTSRSGGSAGDGETELAIVLPSLVFRAGETITGNIVLSRRRTCPTASSDLLGLYDATLIRWRRHPRPAAATSPVTG